MTAVIKAIYISFQKQESKQEPGRYFAKITLEQDDSVLTLSCDVSVEAKLKDRKYKPVTAHLNMSEFNGKLTLKVDNIE